MPVNLPVDILDAAGNVIGTEQVTLPGEARDYDTGYRRRGSAAYQTLRDWEADAAAAHADWPNKTPAQKDAVMRETIRRLGVLCGRLADDLLISGRA